MWTRDCICDICRYCLRMQSFSKWSSICRWDHLAAQYWDQHLDEFTWIEGQWCCGWHNCSFSQAISYWLSSLRGWDSTLYSSQLEASKAQPFSLDHTVWLRTARTIIPLRLHFSFELGTFLTLVSPTAVLIPHWDMSGSNPRVATGRFRWTDHYTSVPLVL